MRLADIYLLLIRLLLGVVFASAGLCKLTAGQFGQLIGPPTADMLPGLEGIWTFLAVSQVAVGALVLSGRWALLGLLALLPLNVGILAYTIGNHWMGTPFVNGFFVVLNLVALAAEGAALRFLVLPEAAGAPEPVRLVRLWPGRALPVAVLGIFGAATASAVLGGNVWLTAGLGALGLAVAWAHALRAPGLRPVERVVLALPGCAMVALSVVPLLTKASVLPIMLLGLVGGTLAVVVPAAVRWWRPAPATLPA